MPKVIIHDENTEPEEAQPAPEPENAEEEEFDDDEVSFARPYLGEEAPEPNDDDVLWDDGPTWGQIKAWKDEHGQKNVFITRVTEDIFVVWRTLTRFEYRRVMKNMEQALTSGQVSQAEANMNSEELITEICALHPRLTRADMAEMPAGLPPNISRYVMEASGFEPFDIGQL